MQKHHKVYYNTTLMKHKLVKSIGARIGFRETSQGTFSKVIKGKKKIISTHIYYIIHKLNIYK